VGQVNDRCMRSRVRFSPRCPPKVSCAKPSTCVLLDFGRHNCEKLWPRIFSAWYKIPSLMKKPPLSRLARAHHPLNVSSSSCSWRNASALAFAGLEIMRPDSLPRLWRYTNLLLTYLLTYLETSLSLFTSVIPATVSHVSLIPCLTLDKSTPLQSLPSATASLVTVTSSAVALQSSWMSSSCPSTLTVYARDCDLIRLSTTSAVNI